MTLFLRALTVEVKLTHFIVLDVNLDWVEGNGGFPTIGTVQDIVARNF